MTNLKQILNFIEEHTYYKIINSKKEILLESSGAWKSTLLLTKEIPTEFLSKKVISIESKSHWYLLITIDEKVNVKDKPLTTSDFEKIAKNYQPNQTEMFVESIVIDEDDQFITTTSINPKNNKEIYNYFPNPRKETK